MTSGDKIRYAIIGTTGIAETHINALQGISNADLVGLISRSKERAVMASKRWTIPAFSSLKECYTLQNPDAIIICTPSGTHLEWAKKAANLGLHVITEKPLETTVKRAMDMKAICDQAKVTLSCIFQNRWSGDYLKVREAAHDGEFGKIILGNAYIKWYRNPEYYSSSDWKGTIKGDGGAALINQGIHTVDLLIQIMGLPISVIGKTRTSIHDIEGEDIALGILSFENGGFGTIEVSTATFPGHPERLEIHGSSGGAILEGGKLVSWNGSPMNQSQKEESSGASDPMAIGYELHRRQLQDITDALLLGSPPTATFKSAIQSLQLIEAIYKSARSGKEINL